VAYGREKTIECKKIPFDTREDALMAMMLVPIKDTGQIPIRVYECPICRGRKWHYTSKQEMKRRK
jgi:hypothetical protein